MRMIISIAERKSGDVEVHIKNEAAYVTAREGRYADAITETIKQHLAKEMPALVKRVLAEESAADGRAGGKTGQN